MNVLVWATTFGADLWSLARYLDQRPDCTVRVVLDDPATFRREGVAHLFPLDRTKLIKRRPWHRFVGVPGFRPDITVMDNRVPLRAPSPAGLMLWHGFGWRGPNNADGDFAWLHHSIRSAFGDARVPNPRFRWQCFGPWDLGHRTAVSGFAPENCRLIGAVSHDDLRIPLDRALAQPFYPFDLKRKTVLLAPTWHYGEVFAHWGTDADLFDRLLAHLHRREANVILRLHDSFRFPRPYRRFLDDLARRYPNVLLKFKDRHPDNFLDLQVADVLVTNFSSIANLFYATLRPTVHVYPVASADEAFMERQYTVFGVREKPVESARFIWKLPPEDNGGLLAHDFDEMMTQIDRGLDEPDCCRDRAQDFLDRHMLGADGGNAERAWAVMQEVVTTAQAAR
ncbi:MAG: CDP-glycerol glycerophosphotransferase family protein [Rhodothermales bacterium]